MSSVLKLSTSLAALLVGLTVANAQVQEEPRQGQGGQGETQMQREEPGSNQQGGAQKERRGGQDGATQERQGSREQRGSERQGADEGQGEKRQRTGQGDADENRQDRNAQTQDRQERREQTDDRGDRRERATQGQDKDRTEQRTTRESTNGDRKKRPNVNITQQNKTIIRERVVTKAPKRYNRSEINFNLSVGTAVPNDFVIYDMPPTIIEIVPEYQGYDYIVVGDMLLIIDPDTREIVDVVEV